MTNNKTLIAFSIGVFFISLGDSSCAKAEEGLYFPTEKSKKEVISFAIENYYFLIDELVQTPGEYSKALCEIAGIPNKKKCFEHLKSAALESKNIADFSLRLSD